MDRGQEVQFEQDRLGNERRKLDTIRAQEGMAGADADNDGILDLASGDTGTNQVVYQIPEHADETFLDQIHAHNDSAGDGTFRILSATLNDDGTINTTTRRSPLISVATTETRFVDYRGEVFTEDAIAINASFEGEFGFAVLSDHKEYVEPDSENF